MWEDSRTGSKWVIVTRCYFPGDLPENVGRPCSPESNEVNGFLVYLFFFVLSYQKNYIFFLVLNLFVNVELCGDLMRFWS